MGIVARRFIKRGEELTVDYDYDLNGEDVPRWYREEHQREKRRKRFSLSQIRKALDRQFGLE